MNIWVLSDLHVAGREYDLRLAEVCPPHVSVLVLAGDIGQGVAAVQWMNEQQAVLGIPFVYVAGHHDLMNWYGEPIKQVIGKMKAHAVFEVHIPDNEQVGIGGVHFLGTTLWTDFEYSDSPRQSNRDLMRAASTFADFSAINVGEGELLTPEAWVAMRHEARDWLQSELLALRDKDRGPRVLVTHHLLSPCSLDPKFVGDATNAAFCSDLPDALLGLANVWIHGHSHHAQDWRGPEDVHVLSNPLGYPGEKASPGFDFVKWVEV